MGLIGKPDGCPPTLGALRTQRYSIHGYCRNPQCWRNFGVDLAGLIELFGPDCFLVELAAKRIVCRVCRGFDVQWRIVAPTPPFAGLTHLASVAGTPVKRVADSEPPLDRYRRLAAGAVMTISPGEVWSIDDPIRPTKEYVPPEHLLRAELRWFGDLSCYGWRRVRVGLFDWTSFRLANDR